jgi:hypothetical protein
MGLPGLLADWVEAIAAGIERNITEPGPLASENVGVDESGRFFNDGRRAVSFWVPVDPVTEATLRFVAGSHLWPKPLLRARRQDVLVR